MVKRFKVIGSLLTILTGLALTFGGVVELKQPKERSGYEKK